MLLLLLITAVIANSTCHNQFVYINKFNNGPDEVRAFNNSLLATCPDAYISHDNGVVVHCGGCYFDPCRDRLSIPTMLTPNLSGVCKSIVNEIDRSYCILNSYSLIYDSHAEVCWRQPVVLTAKYQCQNTPKCAKKHDLSVKIVHNNDTKMDEIHHNNTVLVTCPEACISHDNGIVVHCVDCYYDPCVNLDSRINPYSIRIGAENCTIRVGQYRTYCSLFEQGYSEVCYSSAAIHKFSVLGIMISLFI